MMEGEEVNRVKICVVCSATNSSQPSSSSEVILEGDGGTGGGGDGGEQCLWKNANFSRLLGELELISDTLEEDKSQPVFKAFDFLGGLECEADKLFACEKCLEVISEAMEQRKELVEVENEVLTLQLELLVKLGKLKECADGYYREMGRILERVRGAEVVEVDDEEIIRRIRNYSGRGCGRRRTCDVILFREKIFDVVTYLGMFREDMEGKLAPVQGRRREAVSTSPKSLQINPPLPLLPMTSMVAGREDHLPQTPPSPMEMQEDYDDLEEYRDHTVKTEANAGDCDDDTPLLDRLHRKRPKSRIKKKAEIKEPGETADNEDALDDADDYVMDQVPQSDNDQEFEPSKKKRKYVKRNGKPVKRKVPSDKQKLKKGTKSNNSMGLLIKKALSEVDVSDMTEHKKLLVQGIIRRKVVLGANKPEAIDNHEAGPINMDNLNCWIHWNYDKITDKVSVAGYQVQLVEGSTNSSSTLALKCVTCGYLETPFSLSHPDNPKSKTTANIIYNLQLKMFDHVFAKHLSLYKCPTCAYQASTLHTYRSHQRTHTQSGTCHHCGVKFNSFWSLKAHVQKFHEQDKPSVIHQCAICGKVMSSGNMLREHEDTHRSMEEREHVNCPLCGIRLLKTAYRGHAKRTCRMIKKKEKPRTLCNLCGKSFRNGWYVKEHMRLVHGGGGGGLEGNGGKRREEVKSEKCEICGKTVKHLKFHMRNNHEDGRREQFCKKGCGRRFWYRCTLGKHEEMCGGPLPPAHRMEEVEEDQDEFGAT